MTDRTHPEPLIQAGPRWLSRLPWSVARAIGRIPVLGGVPLAWVLGQDSRRMCKRLILQGWEHWQDFESAAQTKPAGLGGLIEVPWVDAWPVALWAIAAYRGPVTIMEFAERAHGALSPEKRVVLEGGLPGVAEPKAQRVFLGSFSDLSTPSSGTETERPVLRVSARAQGKRFEIRVETVETL